MRLLSILGAFLLCFNSVVTTTVEAQVGIVRTDNSPPNRSALLADCKETSFRPAPLEPRPAVRRATFGSRPVRPAGRKAHAPSKIRKAAPRHKKIVHKKVVRKQVAKKQVAHKRPVHARKRATHKRPRRHAAHHGTPRPLQRVTYASPLCDELTPGMSSLIGLDDMPTQVPVAAITDVVPNEIFDLPPIPGGGTGGPGFPGGPLFPAGPFIILPPAGPGGPGPVNPVNPGGPDTPPVIIPPNPPAIPEPAGWATMIVGFGLIGWVLRRRRVGLRVGRLAAPCSRP